MTEMLVQPYSKRRLKFSAIVEDTRTGQQKTVEAWNHEKAKWLAAGKHRELMHYYRVISRKKVYETVFISQKESNGIAERKNTLMKEILPKPREFCPKPFEPEEEKQLCF